MTYTVKKLAKLSGVSIRTLHFYDEIGLLKPAYYGENKYRYYEEEQLLMLQQILFYKELCIPLNDIQRILNDNNFNKIESLLSHKHILENDLDRKKNLIETIDKTISHLRGNVKMKHEELYYGFDSEKQKGYEKELVKKGVVTQKFMDEYQENLKKWTQKDKDNFLQEGKDVNDAMVEAVEKNLSPASAEAQNLVRRHYAWLKTNPTGTGSWVTKETYIGLSQMYQTPEFKKFYDQHHPKLLAFLVEAMKIFAERELT